jgi:hypothetical protein
MKGKSMEKLDKERYLKRVIIVCWIALAICFGIKLFGGNLFEIMCSNENFIKVCNYADNHFWAKYVIGVLHNTLFSYFLILAICKRKGYSKWELAVFFPTIVIGTFIKLLNSNIGLVVDIWHIIIMPMIFDGRGKKQCLRCLIGNLLIILFQAISMITKNINFSIITNESVLVSLLYSLDVDIMIILYYLYANTIKTKERI